MQNLIIIGAGGLGREVHDLAIDTGAYVVRGFVDANPAANPGVAPVLGTPEAYEIQPGDTFICAIGNPEVRRKVVRAMKARGDRFATLIHPTAIISPSAIVEEGCIIKPYVTIGSRAHIGEHTVLQPHCTIEHDVQVACYCLIGANSTLQGGCKIGTLYNLAPCTRVSYKSYMSPTGCIINP